MDAKDKRYSYDRFGSKGARVGQAVTDILSKEHSPITAGEIIDGYSAKYVADLEKAISENASKYKSPFYVVVLSNKEMWAENVVRNWFIARQTAPYALDMVINYPYHMKTLYITDGSGAQVVWCVPGLEDCKSILKTPYHYDAQLVKWIKECFEGKLERDSYPLKAA